MKINKLINKNIDISNFLSLSDDELFSISNFSEEEKLIVKNRKEYFDEILSSINDNSVKSISIEGFQGTGKTSLLKIIHHFLDDSAYSHMINCTQITTLDDIMMNLFKYLSKITKKQPQKTNVDSQLMNLLKNFSPPLIIVIDAAENLLDEEFKLNDDILNFFEYINSLPQIKLIICGKKTGKNFSPDTKIKLSGLDEDQTYEMLKLNGIDNISKQVQYEIFNITRGYPATIFWFTTAVKILKLTPFDLIKTHSTSTISFEEFVIKKLIKTIPDNSKILLSVLSVIRHPIIKEVVSSIITVENLDETLELLKNISFLAKFKRELYLEDFVKKCVYDEILHHDKIKFHKLLVDFYTSQIPLSPDKRILKISRNSLQAEKFYHFRTALKLNEEFENVGKKSAYIVEKKSDRMTDIKSMSPGILSYMSIAESSKRRDKNQSTEKPEEKAKVEEQQLVDIDIELSEEEKQLINQVSETNIEETSTEPEQISVIEKEELTYNEDEDLEYLLDKASKETNPQIKADLYSKAILLADENILPSLYLELGAVYSALSKHDAEKDCFERALKLFIEKNSTNDILETKLKIANSNRLAYKHEEALREYFSLIEKFRANQMEGSLASAYIGIGDIYNYRLDFDNAIQYYTQALNIAKQNNSAEQIIESAFKIALIYDDILDEKNALSYYKQCAEFENKSTPTNFLASALSNLASIYKENGETNLAIEFYQKSLHKDILINNTEGQYFSLKHLAELYQQLNNKKLHFETLKQALEAAKKDNNIFHIAMSYFELGEFFEGEENTQMAIKSFLLARKIIGNTVSTDSKQKIDRKLHKIQSLLGMDAFKQIIENLKIKPV